ncbi:MAG: hypothetical protein F4040_05550, partial [Synechococcus sp. SB0670_bin_20]|nr:hypothetical protein [Synechococcus sp. SB0670_bin_20]
MSLLKDSPLVEALQTYSAPLEGRRGLLRLDFNENTLGPSPRIVETLENLCLAGGDDLLQGTGRPIHHLLP